MEKFGHFFEFIAALNSAYIVSDFFIESLLKKINSYFEKLNKRLDGIRKNQTNNVIKLSEQVKGLGNLGFFKQTVDRLSVKAAGIEEKFDNLDDDIKQSFQDKNIFVNFNYWCLFGCLYCILILLLNGFEFSLDSPFNAECFFAFSTISSLSLLWFIKEKKRAFLKRHCYPSFNKTIICFFAPLILFPIIVSWLRSKYILSNNISQHLKYTDVILAIILTTGHFFIYYVKSSLFSKKKAKNFKIQLNALEMECEKYGQEIENSFSVVNDLITTTAH